jgi:hypothetical protein
MQESKLLIPVIRNPTTSPLHLPAALPRLLRSCLHRIKSIRAIMRPIYMDMGIIQSPLEPAFEDQAST